LLYRVAKATSKEVRASGSHWTFSPNVEVARDARWGRCGETFGEDPYLVSQLGAAFTTGYQGKLGKDNILACAKHFVAGGEPVNGTNASPMDASERQLREIWLPSFKEQVRVGVGSFMAAHNEVNGIPCHSNNWLMNEVLRDEWGFDGFVVSDWMDIERLHTEQKIAKDKKEAASLAVNAGLDMNMHGPGFFDYVLDQVNEGTISENSVNEACKRILEAKFSLGLFENIMIDPKESANKFFTKENQELSLEAARKSIVLLKNESSILPLKYKKRILVTGPNAHNQRILGDWSHQQPDENVTTVYEGMSDIFTNAQVDYIDCGENIRKPSALEIEAAVSKAADYDAVVVVVGSNSLRYESKEKTCGENIDRANIDFMGNQLELLQEIYKNNKKVIVVMVNGRPLSEPWVKENIPAIIEAWEPGSLGGRAIAEIIKGEVNPSGKLTMSFPYSSGQIVYTYNHKKMHFFHKYIDEPADPLWNFGYGLSYTSFQYSNPVIKNENIEPEDNIRVSVNVQNSGSVAGDEIVQLYIRDNFASVTRPVKELKAYKRISLNPGESQNVSFSVPYSSLGFYNQDMDFVVEPGDFTIMTGPSSRDEDLQSVEIKVN
jgi:beta-glucosidase